MKKERIGYEYDKCEEYQKDEYDSKLSEHIRRQNINSITTLTKHMIESAHGTIPVQIKYENKKNNYQTQQKLSQK